MQLLISIGLHQRDLPLLEKIHKSLGVGLINYKHGPETVQLRVRSLKEIQSLINFFGRFPLVTKKIADFELLKQAFILINNKEHLTEAGLKKLVALKASSNLGLSEKQKLAFADVAPVGRPIVIDQTIRNSSWLAGFTAAEGCF